jgi:hypothetical protein
MSVAGGTLVSSYHRTNGVKAINDEGKMPPP